MNERINIIAKRYGTAMIGLIDSKEEFNTVKNDLENFSYILKNNKDLQAGLHTLLFSEAQKNEFILMISHKTEMNSKSEKFLLNLSEKNRIKYLDDILYAIKVLWLKKQNTEIIKVYSSKMLTKKMTEKLKNNLKQSIKKEVIIEIEVDKTLIAGIKIQRGGQLYDFSIKGNLKRLRDSIIGEGV